MWLLGDNFLRAYYSIYDMDNNRIGLVGDAEVVKDADFVSTPQTTFEVTLGEEISYTTPELRDGFGAEVYAETENAQLTNIADFDEATRKLKVYPTTNDHVGTLEFDWVIQFNKEPTRYRRYNAKVVVKAPEGGDKPTVPTNSNFNEKKAIGLFDDYFYYWLDYGGRNWRPYYGYDGFINQCDRASECDEGFCCSTGKISDGIEGTEVRRCMYKGLDGHQV